jgi:hypothetical protein
LRTVALGAGVIGIGSAAFSTPVAAQIPTQPTTYAVRMTGVSPNEQFDRVAQLLVTPPVDTTGANFNNGVNARDVALVSGFPAGTPEAGAIWYATNTALYRAAGISASDDIVNAALDVAFVDADEQASVLRVIPDGPDNALAAQLNTFTARTSLFASIFVVIEGVLQLQFSADATQVSGVMDFGGVPPTGGANDRSQLRANLAGSVA